MEKNIIKKNIIKWINETKFKEALVHKSLNSEKNYEKLEIIGDAYMNFYTVYFLSSKFSTPSEITNDKKAIVSNENLSKVFEQIELIKYIKLGDSLSFKEVSDKIKGDFIESIIGGIYLDSINNKDYKKILDLFIEKYIIEGFYQSKLYDYKSKVYEIAQKNNIKICCDFKKEGLDHSLSHICNLKLIFESGKTYLLTKKSNTKKQAVQECCKEILNKEILK